MNVLQILKSTNSKFQNLSFKIKVELYLLPLLLILFYFLVFKEDKKVFVSNSFVDYSSLKMKDNLFDIQKKIESFSNKNKIKINKINYSNKSININAQSNLKKLKKLILYLEYINNFSKIDELVITKNKSTYQLSMNISFEKFYLKDKKNLVKKKSHKSNKLVLKAIIANNILVNNKWLKKGDYISGYLIKEILSESVIIEKDGKIKKLKVFKNEKFAK